MIPKRTVTTLISNDVCTQIQRTEEQVYVNGRWETVELVEEEISTPIFSRFKDSPEYIRTRHIKYN